MKKRKFKKSGSKSLFFGALFALASFLISLTVFSIILSLLKNPISLLGIFGIAAYLSSGAISGFVNSKLKGEGGILFAILSSLIVSGVFLAIGIIASGGKSAPALLMNVLCYLLVSALFAKLASLKKKKFRRR